ncbi:MAG: efflux RND transporter permease subunit [Phenylobacterium sp.]|jgi:CzcA family heavy metal efflux pump|uniref:efflux RND transporter permease subunit n=1 Tax=unclassified Phenylobacterium TaxID=2640670 RepID=UPI0008D6D264|nr:MULTISPECIES: efflux RND transporter permease subunit [unclassified Phenylobacterium]MBJ7410181.1 efflux RND transporter permease subunit [Phenylobacterium sp.]OHB28381.1 MAG: RND transporter [Phenylobacterium sp. RIFCSPHIGHO2_01_FULL_69_31]
MLAIVRIALTRPLTFVVMALLIAIGGALAAVRTPVDIFPSIRVPVIAVAWTYAGLPPEEMAGRIITPFERALSATVSDIEHVESQSMPGVGVVKIFFQPGVDIRTATAQLTSISQTVLRQMPPGISPPFIVNYDASTVPILQLALSGEGLTEQQLYDLGLNQVRPQLITVPGAAAPFPSGGRQRQIQIDLDPQALRARGLSAQDVSTAIAAQNQINPAGFAKIGEYQYNVRLNNAPNSIAALNDLPVKVVEGATIYLRDVAYVRDGSAPQTNVVHVDGQRSALITILRNGSASTLSIVDGIKKKLPQIAAGLPAELKITPLGDQSIFVRGALEAVVVEGAIAAALTSLMILLFLGSWRSTAIIALSIPLAVLAAIAALSGAGQTLNVMTLGGLALAIGILVDDATVTIENINWHLEQGKGVREAILDGAAQIVTPAFVSLLCICIVFVPMLFLPGVSGYLFVPMALAVVFALIASFILSRTLVPTMAMYLLRPHKAGGAHPDAQRSANPLVRFQQAFERRFEAFRLSYGGLLEQTLRGRRWFVPGFLAMAVASLAITPWLGRDFFPSVDSGQIALHVRAPAGTRVEETAAEMARVQARIRNLIPANELRSMVDNIGLSSAPLNTVYNNSGTVGPGEGDILIALEHGHTPTERHVERLRQDLPKHFPSLEFAFLPADITSQILNFGSPAPLDIQISGRDRKANRTYAEALLREVRRIPGLADARLQQSARYPQLDVEVDRTRMAQVGLTQRDVTVSLANALAGTSQTAPMFFLHPQNGVSYPVVAQAPEHRVGSVEELRALPVTGANGAAPQTLGALGEIRRSSTASVISHYDIQPTLNIYATAHGRDLGAVARDVERAIERLDAKQPKGSTVTLRGQYATMNTAFLGLGLGLIGAVVLIYLVLVVNFQSWADPLVIVSALPGALAGIVWLLFATGTTLSVPALTGAIMCLGVSTANSVLVVSFARERLAILGDASRAALEAGLARFRPVLMTALAMIIGMAPMALGIGEGGEQNAPLGRAVIGGLVVATAATLFLVPAIFSFVHRHVRRPSTAEESHVAYAP